jgi:uncharacterized membrane protein
MIFNRNPALWLALIQAVIVLAVGFGVELTTDQQGAVMGACAALAALLTGAVTRSQVYSPESHWQALRAARSGSGG